MLIYCTSCTIFISSKKDKCATPSCTHFCPVTNFVSASRDLQALNMISRPWLWTTFVHPLNRLRFTLTRKIHYAWHTCFGNGIIIIKTEHHAYTEMQLECIASGVSNMHAMQCCYSTSHTDFTIHFMYSTHIREDSNTVTLTATRKTCTATKRWLSGSQKCAIITNYILR